MKEYNEDIVNHAIDRLNDGINCEGADLHHEIYNTDYFIIGYYQAEEWLKKDVGIFAATEAIQEYENDNFGEVTTDLGNSEKVCNMYVYIKGEELLNESEVLRNKWDNKLTDKDCKAIAKELEELI